MEINEKSFNEITEKEFNELHKQYMVIHHALCSLFLASYKRLPNKNNIAIIPLDDDVNNYTFEFDLLTRKENSNEPEAALQIQIHCINADSIN